MRSSVTNIIGPDGNVVKGYEYDDFGNTENTGSTDFINDVTFTSSVSDTQSGLQYMNARFYQPATGRFLSQDTYTGNAYDPWTQNLYSYCGNNPLNYVDPTGHILEAIRNEITDLKNERSARIRLTEYYRTNRNNYEKGSSMYNYFNESYWRNQNEVTSLNKQIGLLEEELAYKKEKLSQYGYILQSITEQTNSEAMIIVNPDAEIIGFFSLGMHNNVFVPSVSYLLCNLIKGNYVIHSHPYCPDHSRNQFSTDIGDQTVVDCWGAAGIYLVEPKSGGMFLYDGRFDIFETNKMVRDVFTSQSSTDEKYTDHYELIYTGKSIAKRDTCSVFMCFLG